MSAGPHPTTKRPWTREPLLHFAGLGLLLFGLFRLVAPPPTTGEAIVVSTDTLARIESQQKRRLGRDPSAEELDAAVRAWADAEMLYREARALGLDRGDPIVRRRLTQKLQFMLEQSESLPEPSDAELEAWILAHAEQFEQAPRVAITHVFLPRAAASKSASKLGAEPELELRELETALREGADPATLGHAFPLGQQLGGKTEAELDRIFGAGFAAQVAALPDDDWHRLRSLYGWHLVHVDARTPGRLASVDEVRSQAREGLLREAREQAVARAIDELRTRYVVQIEGAE